MTSAVTTPARPAAGVAPTRSAFDVSRYREDFPILRQSVNGRPLVYLDNAATTQKPQRVIDAIRHYYESDNANVHRGVHALSIRATEGFEQARRKVQQFMNAARLEEIIFVRGATEAINLVAQSYGRTHVKAGDEIVISHLEHHSNIVPWQLLCEQTGARLRVIPINDRGEVLLEESQRLIGPRTRLVSIAHVSNALGTVNPVREISAAAHQHGAVVMVDGAQAAPHLAIDVQALDVDFYAISAHKMYGPTGIGALYARRSILEKMPPYHGGGDMILSVSFEKTTYNDLPYRFEAGTPDIAGAIGMGAAVDYLGAIGLQRIAEYEHDLLAYATQAVSSIPGVRLIGTAANKAAVLSFEVAGAHPHDIGTILDQQGIAVRTGHHCAQPVMERFGVPATVRASLALYNNRADIDVLVAGLREAVEVFK